MEILPPIERGIRKRRPTMENLPPTDKTHTTINGDLAGCKNGRNAENAPDPLRFADFRFTFRPKGDWNSNPLYTVRLELVPNNYDNNRVSYKRNRVNMGNNLGG